jgi:hypothetical protein
MSSPVQVKGCDESSKQVFVLRSGVPEQQADAVYAVPYNWGESIAVTVFEQSLSVLGAAQVLDMDDVEVVFMVGVTEDVINFLG